MLPSSGFGDKPPFCIESRERDLGMTIKGMPLEAYWLICGKFSASLARGTRQMLCSHYEHLICKTGE